MITALVVVFVLGYIAIAVEEVVNVNKTATAILIAVVCWMFLAAHEGGMPPVVAALHEHLGGIAEIIFFLIGAMTIVELINAHNGFKIITDCINTRSKRKLLWIVGILTFFLSAVLDNLTTSIVMVTMLRQLVHTREDRLVFASTVIIAANAGGAWSPIGDVTTTMLWIGGQITTAKIMTGLFFPSLMCLLVPLAYQSLFISGMVYPPAHQPENTRMPSGTTVLVLGVGALMFVPVFKAITHLPPYMGMLFGLGVMWLITELRHHHFEERHHLRVPHALTRIDVTSALFFLAILLAVAALETAGLLEHLAAWLDRVVGDKDYIVAALGLASAVIDNVPLTAAAMGMYDLAQYPSDHRLWEMLAYAVGTGGSCLIIGSAAGVVVMGMEKIDFIWYLRRVTFMALLGYFAGILFYVGVFAPPA